MKTAIEWHGRYLDGGITIPDLIAEVQRDAVHACEMEAWRIMERLNTEYRSEIVERIRILAPVRP